MRTVAASEANEGDYIYRWTEADREAQRPSGEPSDSEMSAIRATLRGRDLTTETDDRGIRVVAIAPEES